MTARGDDMNRFIKDAIFGAIGGVAGTFVIKKTMELVSELQSQEDKEIEKRLMKELPHEKLARVIVEYGLGIEITDETKFTLGTVVQWGYGISWGAAYGILRKEFPQVAKAGGLPFGVGLALLGPAVLLPLFNLSPGAHRLPLSAHARGLVSHYAYAAAVQGVCEIGDALEESVAHHPG